MQHIKVLPKTLGETDYCAGLCTLCPCVVWQRALESWLCLKVCLWIPYTHTFSFHAPFFLLGTLKREREPWWRLHYFHLCVHECSHFRLSSFGSSELNAPQGKPSQTKPPKHCQTTSSINKDCGWLLNTSKHSSRGAVFVCVAWHEL